MKKLSYMLKLFYSICCVLCIIGFSCAQAHAKKHCYAAMSEVLGCFFEHNDGIYKHEFISEDNSKPNITKKTYLLYSQKWPVDDYLDIPTTVWKHKVIFYIPKQISYSKVLLHVTGGRSNNEKGVENFLSPKEQIDCASIALKNKAVVVELQTVPNQYLFIDNQHVKEDQILAYTYKKFMEGPLQNAYLAGHLPMAKAVLKAMDAVQEILKQKYNFNVTGFILSGASKRGWAVWLASLGDTRIKAIIPIVIDVLNTQKSIAHICQSYGGVCPPALRDYEKYNLSKVLNGSAGTALMEVEDPYSYLRDNKYKGRLAIPKYIINASGDDFFVPDSSRWYFKDLPGDSNYIRYLPNAMHYFAGNVISDSTDSLRSINEALSSYFYFILNNVSLPKVSWVFDSNKIKLTSSLKPSMIKLWISNNEHARDFRFITSYTRTHLFMKSILFRLGCSLCDNCYTGKTIPFDCKRNTNCKVQISLPSFKKGWQASFVELYYNIDNTNFIVTTEVKITPDIMPESVS